MYKKFSIILATAILIGSILFITTNKNTGFFIEKKGEGLIRFHVLANSDAPEDQKLKLRVRDRIIEAMEEALEASNSIEETREILINNLEVIEKMASEEILGNGKEYGVKAILREEVFPPKSYGGVVLPAGRYEALKIVIGEGKGENWWCVMFPPLCFVDVKNGLTHEETQRQLKAALSEEEYTLLHTYSSQEELPLKLKFKIVEVFKDSRKFFGQWASKF